MPRGNTPFIAFNRGLISERSLARVDLDRTRLSASLMNNWLPKTQGNMIIRPGTKFIGNTHNDTGCAWIEFVAATDDVALLELSSDTGGDGSTGISRFYIGSDAHNLSLIERPAVNSTVNLSDTGWSNQSTGGTTSTESTTDELPTFSGSNKKNGIRVLVHADWDGGGGITGSDDWSDWRAVDDDLTRSWRDTGKTTNASTEATIGRWIQIEWDYSGPTGAGENAHLGEPADTGSVDTGMFKSITSYSIRAGQGGNGGWSGYAPGTWRVLTSNHDTGTYWTDTGKWTLEHSVTDTGAWEPAEKRTYDLFAKDTGTIEAKRIFRIHIDGTAWTQPADTGSPIIIGQLEMFTGQTASQFQRQSGRVILNAQSIGGLARGEKQVVLDTGVDAGKEHSLYIDVERGPVVLRVGSTQFGEDYINESSLGTGIHNLSFTPTTNFFITLQSKAIVDRIVRELRIGDTGTLEIQTPWVATDLENVRYDQSADVVYADCKSVQPKKFERRGTGRSWSLVNYEPNDGPIRLTSTTGAELKINSHLGNAEIESDVPFFTSDRVGALIRMFSNGQTGIWNLGASNEVTGAVEVTGIGDTGTTAQATNERRINFQVSGTYVGSVRIERSFDGPDVGFKQLSAGVATSEDTGTFTVNVDDRQDNIKVWYRARLRQNTSGVAVVRIGYNGGATTGIARITEFIDSQKVKAEILQRFSDTGTFTGDWEEGYWSDHLGYPTAVQLHGGRLYHAQGGSIFGSVSDDYESYSDEVEGDSAPIIRTLGSGPVDNIHYLISLLRLIIGTSGAEIALRSSSLDEAVTPENSNARTFSTQGSGNLRALKMDTNAIFVQRSGQRVFLIGFGLEGDALGDYKNSEMTFLVPELLEAGVVSLAIQRQPDTRCHFVLADGTVAILTYEPEEEVLAWSTWSTDTGTDSKVEQAMVLPAENEDAVYYQIKRTINGTTSRFLEKWAKESECYGDTGLHWLADCAVSYTDTGRTNTITGLTHLIGQTVVGWGSLDTGSTPHIDLTPDSEGVQQLLTVDTGGAETLSFTEGVHHAVVGLPFRADYRSTKLAYGAEAGTALSQMKRTDKLAFVLYRTHNNALFFGNDTGLLDPLPRVWDEGAEVDPDKIYQTLDRHAIPFPGLWDEDSRIYLRAVAPRPATVLAMVPTINTNDKA